MLFIVEILFIVLPVDPVMIGLLVFVLVEVEVKHFCAGSLAN
jgi:hypothetical protein